MRFIDIVNIIKDMLYLFNNVDKNHQKVTKHWVWLKSDNPWEFDS